jgi:3-hydroxyisobutyrate dehydrogenase-like beta-hydroxyacid dehydrogenase
MEETAQAIRPMSEKLNEGTVVGAVGVGDMGGGIASAILRHYPLVVNDLRKEAVDKMVAKGARSASSLEELADQCNVAVVIVFTDDQAIQVVGTLLKHPGRLQTIIVSSTILPSTIISLDAQARGVGIDIVDAPVSGGAEKAESGIITILVGGELPAVTKVWPVLQAYGKDIYHIGPVGAGSTGKLITNMMSLGTNMLLLEAMQLADAYGITEDSVTEFLPNTSGDSRVIRTWGRYDRMRRSHTLAGTPAMYEVFGKDMKIAAKAAGQRGVTLPIAAAMSSMIMEKTQERDRFLEARGMTGPTQRCPVCTLELAYAYQKAGYHPECMPKSE